MSVKIQPLVETTIKTSYSITCNIIRVNLGKSAVIVTNFYDEKNDIVKSVRDTLENEDYANWGNDDDYVYNWICNKYGITRAE